MYGPMAGVGGLIYDKDAIYVQTNERQKRNEVTRCITLFYLDLSIMAHRDNNSPILPSFTHDFII